MRKDKSGKIIVSLTEVKNKTGDVFALVDQYGAVFLTSYNKIRYRIEKVGMDSLFENGQDQSIETVESKNINVDLEPNLQNKNPMDKIIIADIELIESPVELEYIKTITRPLI